MFKAPNIKGPRFRKNFKRVLTRKLFKDFQKNSQYSDLTFEQFRDIIENCSKKMWRVTIDERDGIQLPNGGSVFIGSTKIRVKNNYDISASIAANTPIKHRNYATDGHVAKIYYSPYLSKISGRDRSLWSFKGNREYKRTLSEEYPKDWKKYIMVSGLYTVVNEYKRHKKRHYFKDLHNGKIQNYNEFDIN